MYGGDDSTNYLSAVAILAVPVEDVDAKITGTLTPQINYNDEMGDKVWTDVSQASAGKIDAAVSPQWKIGSEKDCLATASAIKSRFNEGWWRSNNDAVSKYRGSMSDYSDGYQKFDYVAKYVKPDPVPVERDIEFMTAENNKAGKEKTIDLYIKSLLKSEGVPMKGFTYTIDQIDDKGNVVKSMPIEQVNDSTWKAKVTYDPVNGTRFALSEGTADARYTSNLVSPLTEGAHAFVLRDDKNARPVSVPDDPYFDYGSVTTDTSADSTFANPGMTDGLSIDQMSALDYKALSSGKAQFLVYHGIAREIEKRDYTLELTVGKEVVNGQDPNREYEFTVMPLFGRGIDAKRRYNIAIPGEVRTDLGGRLSDFKVDSVWLNSPTGNNLVDKDWLMVNLKYVLQLTIPGHTGPNWQEKTWESLISQFEKANYADAGFISDDGHITYEGLKELVEKVNKNTDNFFEYEGNHLLKSAENLKKILKEKGYSGLEDFLRSAEAGTDYTASLDEFVKMLQDAGFTQNDVLFLRVMSQNGLTTDGSDWEGGLYERTIEAYKKVLGEDNEILQYFMGKTFKLKAGETITFTIPNKVSLDETGGLMIAEKQSDDYVSSGNIMTYYIVAPDSVKDGGTWSTKETVVNTFEEIKHDTVMTPNSVDEKDTGASSTFEEVPEDVAVSPQSADKDTPASENSSKTGDNATLWIPLGLLLLACLSGGIVYWRRRMA